MPSRKKSFRTLIYILEIAVIYGISSYGRMLFDRAAVSLSPAWLVTVLKLLLFVVLIVVAVVADAQLERYLKSRGWNE